MKFSSLVPEITGTTNRLYALHHELWARGETVVDLIKGNVTAHGLNFPEDILCGALFEALQCTKVYSPDPFGQPAARATIARYYSQASLEVSAEHIVLTPGTSISFWYLFKLLAEPGDEILCPRPSYPLFDVIAKLCGVKLTSYNLDAKRQWAIDFDHLEKQITDRTRALVLISPHNPTGMVADSEQVKTLSEIATRHELPIIADEVFCQFLYGMNEFPRVAQTNAPLVFTLNGLSKSFALPGLKLGWIAVSGNEAAVESAMSALEIISDTFLPVSELAQFSLPTIMTSAQRFLQKYIRTITYCRDAAITELDGLDFVAPRGGFYLTIPVNRNEDDFAYQLLEQELILVHPGYFYDIEGNHIVTTFIHDPITVSNCFRRIKQFIGK